MIAAAVTPLSAEIILLQFALATTLDGICALIALKFCRAQCKSRRFATETSLVSVAKRMVFGPGSNFQRKIGQNPRPEPPSGGSMGAFLELI